MGCTPGFQILLPGQAHAAQSGPAFFARRRALEFLGLPWEPKVLDYRERLRQKAVASPTYEAVSQPLHTRAIGRWKNYQKYLEPCLPALQPSIDAFGY